MRLVCCIHFLNKKKNNTLWVVFFCPLLSSSWLRQRRSGSVCPTSKGFHSECATPRTGAALVWCIPPSSRWAIISTPEVSTLGLLSYGQRSDQNTERNEWAIAGSFLCWTRKSGSGNLWWPTLCPGRTVAHFKPAQKKNRSFAGRKKTKLSLAWNAIRGVGIHGFETCSLTPRWSSPHFDREVMQVPRRLIRRRPAINHASQNRSFKNDD